LAISGLQAGIVVMNRVTVRMAALTVLSAMLLGCATTAAVKDATVLSDSGQKGKDENSAASRRMGAPTNIDGAIKQAQAQRKTGDFSDAAHTLSQLVLLAPDDARVLGEYGKTLIAMGRSDDALAFLERAVELQPKDWSLFSAQGVAHDQKGEYLAAQKAYDRALMLKPGDPTVLSNAALSHMQTGDLDGAERLLMQASPFAAEFPRIASNLALVRSLKTSRPPQTPSVAPPKGPAPVASPAQAAAPSAPVAPVAILPIPQAKASDISIAPPPPSVTEMPARPQGDVAATASALERLRMDPSVYVQPLPVRRPADMVKPKSAAGRPGTPGNAPKAEPVLQMRPTPDDDKTGASPPKKRPAKSAGSTAALDSGGQGSEPLALRPPVADPQARREASTGR
jgi:Flp pilus assembly protein TadD